MLAAWAAAKLRQGLQRLPAELPDCSPAERQVVAQHLTLAAGFRVYMDGAELEDLAMLVQEGQTLDEAQIMPRAELARRLNEVGAPASTGWAAQLAAPAPAGHLYIFAAGADLQACSLFPWAPDAARREAAAA